VFRHRSILLCLLVSLASLPGLEAHQPHDALLITATSPNYTVDQTMIVTSDYLSVSIGVYAPWRSTDGGKTFWVMRDLPNTAVNSVDFSPAYAADRTIYIAGNEGLFRSIDGGDSWTPIGPTAGTSVTDLAISPAFATDNTLLAITLSNQCWKSTDRGATWTQVAAPAAALSRIIFNPRYPTEKTVLMGTGASGLYYSGNLGGTWNKMTPAWKKVTQILYSPSFATDRQIWATTLGGGVYRTTNAGSSWSASNSGITDLNINSIAVSPTFNSDGIVYVASRTGVFRSTNSGLSWTAASQVTRELSTQTQSHYRTLSTGRLNGSNYLYVGMFEGLWSSTDSGNSWVDLDMIPAYLIRKISVSGTFPTDQSAFATCYGGGALWTTDGGQTWAYKNVGLANSYPDGNAISPNYGTDHKAFLGNGAGAQTFNGTAWAPTRNLGARTYVRALAVSPNFAVDNTVFMGSDNIDTGNPATVIYNGHPVPNQGVFRSSDGGVTYAPTGLAGPRISGIVISPNFASDRTMFASSPDGGLFKSVDGGATWSHLVVTPIENTVLEVEISPTYQIDSTLLAASATAGIFKSTDGGATWSEIPGSSLLTGLNMAFSPAFASDSTIYFGTMQKGLLKSIDGGQTLLPTGLPNAFVMNVVLSPDYISDQTLFATTYQGVYKSTNGGVSWNYTFNPARMEQNREGNVTTAGTWTTISANPASTLTALQTTQPLSSATITFTGSSVKFIGTKGPNLGLMSISLDGISQGLVNLYSPSSLWQQALWQASGLPCALHTLTVTAATSGTGRTGLIFDAVDYGRETCAH